MTENYGPLVRLWGVSDAQVPDAAATSTQLKPLLTSILGEALAFISDVPPPKEPRSRSSWRSRGTRHFPLSNAGVDLFDRTVSASALRGVAGENTAKAETWTLRRSVHEDVASAGTASWDEFVRCFKDSHAETELAFTPSVTSTRLERTWDCSGIEVDVDGDIWEKFTLRLEESVHQMPSPLQDRVFPVCQMTAAAVGRKDFIVAQIAAGDVSGVGDTSQTGNVVGAYTSIERFRRTDDGIEWIMGTVSDAKGDLPGWMQRMATPGIVVRDVDMFLGWLKDHREKSTG